MATKKNESKKEKQRGTVRAQKQQRHSTVVRNQYSMETHIHSIEREKKKERKTHSHTKIRKVNDKTTKEREREREKKTKNNEEEDDDEYEECLRSKGFGVF